MEMRAEAPSSFPGAGAYGKVASAQSKTAIVILAAVLVLTLLGPLISYKPAPFSGEGSPLRQIAYVLLAAAVAINARPWARPEQLFPIPLVLTLALVWCWISVSWAIDPGIAARRIALTTIALWTVFLAVRQGNYADVMRLTRVVLVGFLIANYVAALGFPAFGVHQFDTAEDAGLIGAWRGVLLHKNHVGSVSAFTVVAFVFDAKRIRPALRAAIILAAFFCLYKSMSKTSMGILLFSLACGWIYIRYNPAYRILLIPLFGIVASIAYYLAIIYWEEIAAPFSNPQGFTGRVHIWTTALRSVADHPWFGVGYGGFWNAGDHSPLYDYAEDWVSLIGSAHSGYIDLMVQLGIPGMIFVVFAAVIWPLIKLLASRQIARGSGGLLLAWLLFCAGHNFTETSLFYRDEIVQIFLSLTLALIWKETAPFVSPSPPRRKGVNSPPAEGRGLPRPR